MYHFFSYSSDAHRHLHSFPTRRSSDLAQNVVTPALQELLIALARVVLVFDNEDAVFAFERLDGPRGRACFFPHASRPHCRRRSEEHTSELQSLRHLVCRLLLEKKKKHD